MAITNGYCTLAEVKARLDIDDTDDDSVLESVVEGVSRMVDEYCGRRFYTTGTDETRYFTAEFTDVLYAGDLVSVTTLKTDDDGDRVYETAWTASDYDLEPFNAALDDEPYTEVQVSPNGDYSFPMIRKGIEIVGKWGWPSTPKQVHEACLLQAARLFKRKDTPFGVMGSADMGQLMVLPKLDPDVGLLLMPFRKMDVLGV